MIVSCKVCAKEFNKNPCEINKSKSGNHFCNRSCSAKFNNVGLQKNPPIVRICNKCKTEYRCSYGHRSVTLCLVCADTYKNYSSFLKEKTLSEYWERESIVGKHPSWKNAHIRILNRSWNKNLLKNGCQVCGYTLHCELAHIAPISSFAETATLGEVNDASNMLILCPNHHWEFDNGHIKLIDITKRK